MPTTAIVTPPCGAATTTRLPELVARVPLFAGLPAEQLAVMAKGCSRVALKKGAVLFHQGDEQKGFYFVLSGQMQLTVCAPDGSEKVIEIITAGETFAEAVVFSNQPYPVTATALVPTHLLHVANGPVLELLDRDPSFARKMLANLARRLHGLVRDVEQYSLASGAQRVIGLLLYESTGNATASPRTVTLSASKQVVASRLNLAPETLSRILHDLASEGLIGVSGRNIMLYDVPALTARLEWQ